MMYVDDKFEEYLRTEPAKAVKFLQSAFAKRCPGAAYHLAELYRDGKHVPPSKAKAMEMFRKAMRWSLHSPKQIHFHTWAVDSIRKMGADPQTLVAIENSNDFSQDDINTYADYLTSSCLRPDEEVLFDKFIGRINAMVKEDVSYATVKSELESGHTSLLLNKTQELLTAYESISQYYPDLCAECRVTPRKLKPVAITDLYPFLTYSVRKAIVENVLTMFLSIRCSQAQTVKSFTLADESDMKYLDGCDTSENLSPQFFMLSIWDLKSALRQTSFIDWQLLSAALMRDYDNARLILEELNEHLESIENNIDINEQILSNAIPNNLIDMFDPSKSKEQDNDDFDKLLDDFIKNELNFQHDDKRFAADRMTDSSDDVAPLNISSIKLAYDFESANADNLSLRTFFRQSEGENLHVDLVIDNQFFGIECRAVEVRFEVVATGGAVLGKLDQAIFIDRDNSVLTHSLTFEGLKLSEGDYSLQIIHNGNIEHEKYFCIVDLPDSYTQCFTLTGFGIYRIDNSRYENVEAPDERNCQSCFNMKNLAGLNFVMCADNILDKGYDYQFILSIYNELGAEVVTNITDDKVDYDDNKMLYLSYTEDMKWQKGTYKVKIEFFGEVVVSAEFVIGTKDIITLYQNCVIQPKSNTAGRGIIRNVDDPLSKLNMMIGLDGVKETISSMLSKIEIDKIRTINGLKTKSIALHAVFLGNPGTGKTTVAKLLGQIYKDIGLLSSGHVVVEERSTLTGRQWNAECDLTNKAIEKAKGGILFIDEAYDLVTEHPEDPGRLIISTLLAKLADETDRDWMLILAGYPAEMEKLLNVNPGFRSRMTVFNFADFSYDELRQVENLWLAQNDYTMSEAAREAINSLLKTAIAQKDKRFGNARFVNDLFEKQIIPAMSKRLSKSRRIDSVESLKTIEFEDIPNALNGGKSVAAIEKFNCMVGLDELKSKINAHLGLVRFANLRRDKGIHTTIPPMHMIFTGNPGTGKTTVADYLGEIYKSMGLLSVGRVVKVSRADMVGSHIGETERKMSALLSAARGNILFIDEAYTLFNGTDNSNDFGHIAVDALLDTLSKENIDMMVIMAGYTKKMEELLKSNQGLSGRFPYHFEFKDYTVDALIRIAEGVCKDNDLILSPEAKTKLIATIRKELRIKDASFSNARFVVRLITTQIMPNMGARISQLQGDVDETVLKTIQPEDIPISSLEAKLINGNLFDEEAIGAALNRLDGLVGLKHVKRAIHEFVDVAREMNAQNRKFIGKYPLKWSFSGNTGTGKSTVAEILSEILKGMYLLGKGHVVEVKAEELYAINTYQADELLKKRMKESQQGLLFVDGDSPQSLGPESRYNPDYLRMTLAANTAVMPGTYAVVIAENRSPRQSIAEELVSCGITEFDHTLVFEDYSADELLEILKVLLRKYDLELDSQAEAIMKSYIDSLCAEHRNDYANARTMKLLSRAIRNRAILNKSCNGMVSGHDVEEFASAQPQPHKIGYVR